MEHFIAVGIAENKLREIEKDGIVESLMSMADGLYESGGYESHMAIAEGEEGEPVLMIALPAEPTNEQANVLVHALAEKLFDYGHTEFDIYVSGEGE